MFQNPGAQASSFDLPARAGHTAREEASDLIGRYPNLGETELARLINLYREFSALDSALILSDDALAPKLDRFTSDHRPALRKPLRQYAGLLAYAAVAVAVIGWTIVSVISA